MYDQHTKRHAEKRAARESAEAAPVEPAALPFDLDLTNAEALKLLPDAEFDWLYSSECEAQRVLDESAATAESAARKALADFQITPTRDSLADRDIAQALSTNAEKAARENREKIAPLLGEGNRRSERRELTELRQRADLTARYAAAAATVLKMVEDFEHALRDQLADLQAFHAERNQFVRRLATLEEIHGNGSRHREQDITAAVHAINERLKERFGTQLNMNGVGRVHMSSWLASGSGVPTIDFGLRLTPIRGGI